MIRGLLSQYAPNYPQTLVYMLQSTEYQPRAYLQWIWRTKNFSRVMHRRSLDSTRTARLLLAVLSLGIVLQLAAAAALAVWSLQIGWFGWVLAVVLFISYPVVWAHLAVVPLWLGRVFIAGPREKRLIAQSERVFAHHSGTIIAVAGSYGKTTMKELLLTVLSEGKKVAATPANKNVAVSHARFAARLDGNEDIVIIEYGEGAPGDVGRFVRTTHPDIGIITGIAPAHLDRYKTLDAAARDIFSLAEHLAGKQIYVNQESLAAQPYLQPSHERYGRQAVMGWKISDITVGYDGTRFVMKKNKQVLKLHSGLLGRHQVGPLALAAALSDNLGLTKAQIERGIAATQPFEHRMQPRVVAGAWVLDDTYNGNLEGLHAGIELLKELPAKRKIYVTPGLVDQGAQTAVVHRQAGEWLAAANFDMVVLMQNSVSGYILEGLKTNQQAYTGEIRIETNPLEFYANLELFVGAGDTVLMQNDWTDNYA